MENESEIIDYESAYRHEKDVRRAEEFIHTERINKLNLANEELKKVNEALILRQKQLIKAEKLAGVGVLSAGMAHEINNPLAFVVSNLSTLKYYCRHYVSIINQSREFSAEFPITEERIKKFMAHINSKLPKQDIDYVINDTSLIFEEVETGLNRIRNIVASLRDFSKTKSQNDEASDVNEALRLSLIILEKEIDMTGVINTQFGDLGFVHSNMNDLCQVFRNIILNGIEASNGVVEISVTTEQVQDEVLIRIKDSGIGIDPENLDKIFLPFYTDKHHTKGAGLGLSVSYGIIKELDGRIEVESEIKKGSCFKIFIPSTSPCE